MSDNTLKTLEGTTMDAANDKSWPDGYCRDPDGRIIPPAGKHEDFNFGYDQGYADGLLAIRTSIEEIERRALTKYLRGEKE